ncbi:Pimeloyl-ACP methyl ester carboxylesterase [Prauserella aidingensis]|uniref:alpha/beta fold hydrolase n=1 Tax=Prauserella aidingensis TaxID=387890 RepID=UPI0020A5C289|nr:alpha/beta hydrolase [Prauserella aidingensis]MCP2252893.1 Pimeloyl-ACP methyl ester carboxylesterase [Prauserella aidingensis]
MGETVRADTGALRLDQRIRVEAGEVATGVYGSGSPVVLTHGTPASAQLWRHVVPELAHRHTVYVWDLLGFGESTLDGSAAPSIATQAATLAELVGHWELTSPDLVGHDIGGGVVARAHLVEGVPARRLAFLDAAVIGPWNTAFTEHMQRYADAYRTMPEHAFADLVAPRLRTATHHGMSDDVLDLYLAPWRGTEGQRRWVAQAEHVHFDDTREAVEHLGDITADTLVLWGEQDGWLAPEVGDRLAAAVPGARREDVPGAGHFAPEDAPHAVARSLTRFFV